MIRNISRLAVLACAWAVIGLGFWTVGAERADRTATTLFFVFYLLLVPLGLLSGAAALLHGATPWNRRLFQSLVCKILLIQFFRVNLTMGAAGLLVGLFFGPALLMTLYAALAAWMVVFSVSGDVIRALREMRREGVITKGQQIFHSVCQLIFVADIIDTAVLCLSYSGMRRK